MNPKIIYEDRELMVIDKPPGWVVNNAESVKGETIQEWLAANFQFPPKQSGSEQAFSDFWLRKGIVHRLDKETSGVLLAAKTEKAFRDLQRQFKERKVEKTYLALVHGKVEPGEGEIKIFVGRLPWNRERFGVIPGGRESLTLYKAIKQYYNKTIKNEFYALVEFYPRTGRTHQIRIHAKYLGHPIVSDKFYAGRKTARNDRKWCPRLFLHASGIRFKHPTSGKAISISSKFPPDLKKCLRLLEKVSDNS